MSKQAVLVFEKYKEPFLYMLEDMCVTYKLIGSGTYESPMWLQYHGIHDTGNEKQRPKFKSSQCSLGFYLNYIDEEDKQLIRYIYSEVYDYFKLLKYNYIQDKHPTIYRELRN